MLREALGAPIRSDDSAGTLIVGGVLLLFAVLFPFVWLFALSVSLIWLVLAPLAVFPPLVALGYDLRAIEAGIRDQRAIQPFVGWGELARNGARSLLLRLVYLLPTIVAVVVAGGVVNGVEGQLSGQSEEIRAAAIAFVVGVTTLLVLAHLVIYLYVWPAALAVLVSTGRLRSALSPRRVVPVALSNGYVRGWMMAAIVLAIGGVVSLPLTLIVVGFVIAFYVRAVSYYVYGTGTRQILSVPEESAHKERESERDKNESERDKNELEREERTTPESSSGVSAPDEQPSTARTSWSPRVTPEPNHRVQIGRTVEAATGCDERAAGDRRRGAARCGAEESEASDGEIPGDSWTAERDR